MDCKLSVVARMEGEHKTDVYEKVMDNSQEIFQIFFFFYHTFIHARRDCYHETVLGSR